MILVGPCHQSPEAFNSMDVMPREFKSAGLDLVVTWCQRTSESLVCISETRLATKVVHVDACLESQSRTIRESVKQRKFGGSPSQACFMSQSNRVKRVAPHNSSFGMLSTFKGATLVLAASK